MSTTPSIPWPTQMHTDDWNHASSTMLPSLPTSPLPYSTLVSPTSPMDGSMAPTMKTPTASGAHIWGIQLKDVPRSRNVSSVMGLDTSKPIVVTCTSDVEWDGSAMCPMTTPALPTLPAMPTLGPSDVEKDVNKGVMSRETSRHHVTQRGDSPLLLYDSQD